MAWLSASSEVLAVIDTHGRLCLLSGGAFERLQLVDTVSSAAVQLKLDWAKTWLLSFKKLEGAAQELHLPCENHFASAYMLMQSGIL